MHVNEDEKKTAVAHCHSINELNVCTTMKIEGSNTKFAKASWNDIVGYLCHGVANDCLLNT